MSVLQSSGLLLLLLAAAAIHVDAKKYYEQYHDHRYENYDRRSQWDSPPENRYQAAEKYQSYAPGPPPDRPYGPKIHTFIANYGPSPPPPEQGAVMARYIVHNAGKKKSAEDKYQDAEKFQAFRPRPGPDDFRDPKNHTYITNYGPNPPPPEKGALMARYIVHNADWASIATISSNREVRTFPFANIVSISDGTPTNSSGVPYMYMTPMDMSSQDLEIDSRCSMAISLAEGDYCKQKSLDPEDPRCARVILTGKLKKIKTYTPEIEYAENAVFTRHPAMKGWPASHNWFFAKIKIEQIVVLDYFGGPKFISKQDYFNPPGMRQ